MRRFFVSSRIFSLTSFAAFAQAKHPFTFEDMMKLKRVGEPEVFARRQVGAVQRGRCRSGGQHQDAAHLDRAADQWATDGAPETRRNSSPIRMPTVRAGRRMASGSRSSRRKKAARRSGLRISTARRARSAGVHKLTSIATEAGGELWSPDGKNILFTSDVYPECDGDACARAACNAKKLKEAREVEGQGADLRPPAVSALECVQGRQAQPHLCGPDCSTLRDSGRAGGAASVRAVAARDLTPGDYDAPVFSLGGQDNYAFSPDGQEICYTSNHDKVEATSTNNDLWIVPVNGGAAKNITADNPASDSTPLYSPDGKYIAYRAQQRPGYESDRFRLMLYDRKTGEKKNLTEDFDRWVGTFAWAPDSSEIYFRAENEGASPIYCTVEPIGVADADRIDRQGLRRSLDYMSLTDDCCTTTISSSRTDAQDSSCFTADDRLQRTDAKSTKLACPGAKRSYGTAAKVLQLTHLNDAVLSQVAMSPLEPFWFTGAKATKSKASSSSRRTSIASKKYPVKFLIHGGPQGAWGDDWCYRWNPELFAANGYVVVMINFHGSTGYGQKFIDAINGDWGGAPFEDLMKGLDYAEKTYPFIDKDRECALGASYGGYMANWMLGHTDRFKCIVSHDGMFNAESAWGTTEELWFNEWEFKGTPVHESARCTDKWSPHNVRQEFQDADAGHPRAARLPARRQRRLPALHHAAADGRAVEDALLPRRRPLGAEAAEFAALVQDGE